MSGRTPQPFDTAGSGDPYRARGMSDTGQEAEAVQDEELMQILKEIERMETEYHNQQQQHQQGDNLSEPNGVVRSSETAVDFAATSAAPSVAAARAPTETLYEQLVRLQQEADEEEAENQRRKRGGVGGSAGLNPAAPAGAISTIATSLPQPNRDTSAIAAATPPMVRGNSSSSTTTTSTTAHPPTGVQRRTPSGGSMASEDDRKPAAAAVLHMKGVFRQPLSREIFAHKQQQQQQQSPSSPDASAANAGRSAAQSSGMLSSSTYPPAAAVSNAETANAAGTTTTATTPPAQAPIVLPIPPQPPPSPPLPKPRPVPAVPPSTSSISGPTSMQEFQRLRAHFEERKRAKQEADQLLDQNLTSFQEAIGRAPTQKELSAWRQLQFEEQQQREQQQQTQPEQQKATEFPFQDESDEALARRLQEEIDAQQRASSAGSRVASVTTSNRNSPSYFLGDGVDNEAAPAAAALAAKDDALMLTLSASGYQHDVTIPNTATATTTAAIPDATHSATKASPMFLDQGDNYHLLATNRNNNATNHNSLLGVVDDDDAVALAATLLASEQEVQHPTEEIIPDEVKEASTFAERQRQMFARIREEQEQKLLEMALRLSMREAGVEPEIQLVQQSQRVDPFSAAGTLPEPPLPPPPSSLAVQGRQTSMPATTSLRSLVSGGELSVAGSSAGSSSAFFSATPGSSTAATGGTCRNPNEHQPISMRRFLPLNSSTNLIHSGGRYSEQTSMRHIHADPPLQHLLPTRAVSTSAASTLNSTSDMRRLQRAPIPPESSDDMEQQRRPYLGGAAAATSMETTPGGAPNRRSVSPPRSGGEGGAGGLAALNIMSSTSPPRASTELHRSITTQSMSVQYHQQSQHSSPHVRPDQASFRTPQAPAPSSSASMAMDSGRNKNNNKERRALELLRRGQEETERAVRSGRALIVQCQNCQGRLQAPMGYSLVYCPYCKTVSPVPNHGSNEVGPTDGGNHSDGHRSAPGRSTSSSQSQQQSRHHLHLHQQPPPTPPPQQQHRASRLQSIPGHGGYEQHQQQEQAHRASRQQSMPGHGGYARSQGMNVTTGVNNSNVMRSYGPATSSPSSSSDYHHHHQYTGPARSSSSNAQSPPPSSSVLYPRLRK